MDPNHAVKIVSCNDFKASALERLDVSLGGISPTSRSDGVNRFTAPNDS